MTATIIDGKAVANSIISDIKDEITARTTQGLSQPGLAVILIGTDGASEIYVKHKQKACERAGILSTLHHLPQDTSEKQLTDLVHRLNNDQSNHGILIQLPLPKHINTQRILETITIEKDVDGFHPYNFGRLAQGHPTLQPCTPAGVMWLIQTTKVELAGLHAVVVGASNIVGRPMALALLRAGCTVTICHSKTKDLSSLIKQADLLVTAVGQPRLIKGEWIKPGAILLDIGITRLDNGKLSGDIDFEAAKQHAAWITPVPGGVGPMTVAMLMKNTLSAAKQQC
jgi:methylenetetrahydrofolate dehydrogenase (NADP+) / methenyltetrahydrofolate cyclohydrolase